MSILTTNDFSCNTGFILISTMGDFSILCVFSTFRVLVRIVFFAFFYTAIVFNPEDTADNLRKYGGYIPGIRPGKSTADYLDFVLTRLTVLGAAYLAAVCICLLYTSPSPRDS